MSDSDDAQLVTSPEMRKQIEEWEGLRLRAYRDPNGILTIGYGHTGPDVESDLVISPVDADRLLSHDLSRFESEVWNLIDGDITQGQFDALVSFAYNVGASTLGRSRLLEYHNLGRYELAALEFVNPSHPWFSALPGLKRRREGEREFYLSS